MPVYLSAGPLGFGGGSTPTLQMRVWNNQGQTVTAYSNTTIRGSSPRRITALGGGGGVPTPRRGTRGTRDETDPMCARLALFN